MKDLADEFVIHAFKLDAIWHRLTIDHRIVIKTIYKYPHIIIVNHAQQSMRLKSEEMSWLHDSNVSTTSLHWRHI